MKSEQELRSRIDNLPEWKKQWVKEAAAPFTREHFFAVTKPRWKEIDTRMKETQEQAAKEAGFRDFTEVKGHIEWTRFGTPETALLEKRIKTVEQSVSDRMSVLLREKNEVAAKQEALEYRLLAEKADMLDRYTRYAIRNVKQILANGHLIMECDIDGLSKDMMALIPEALAKAIKGGLPKEEAAAQLFSGELLMLDKYRKVVLENGQVIDAFIHNRRSSFQYRHQYQLADVEGQRMVLNKLPDDFDHKLALYTDTPIEFNGSMSLNVEYMRPRVELERARLSEIQLTTGDIPYIRCKVDDVQQMRVRMDEKDKALYTDAKNLWGIRTAAELSKVFAEKYYADTLEQDMKRTISR